MHFEKVVVNLHWFSEIQAMLLKSDKAREVYSALSVKQKSDYSLLKSKILQPYEFSQIIIRSSRILNVQKTKLIMNHASGS